MIKLADALSVVERKIIVLVRHIDSYILNSNILLRQEHSQLKERSISEAEIILQEFQRAQNGERSFSANYLKNKSLYWYWDRMVKASEIVLVNLKGTDQPLENRITSELFLVQIYASQLPILLRGVARDKKLNRDIMNAFREKWMKLDEMVELWYKAGRKISPGDLLPW